MPVTNIQKKDEFWLKDQKYSIFDIFKVDEEHENKFYADKFVGGTIYQGFLDPLTYHRWHSPVSGTIEKEYLVDGLYFVLNPNIDNAMHKSGYINSQPFISTTSVRRIMIIKADNEKIGYVTVVFIGMADVSSCVLTKKTGDRVEKGEYVGHF